MWQNLVKPPIILFILDCSWELSFHPCRRSRQWYSYMYHTVFLPPHRADYQRISEEIQRRGRKPPPPLPPSDPRTPPHRMEPTLPRQLPPRDRSRTVVGRPPVPPEGYSDFDVSSWEAVVISWDMDLLCLIHMCPGTTDQLQATTYLGKLAPFWKKQLDESCHLVCS